MKINEVITERQQQKTEIMYHGTSTNLVRSIMKNGLLANPPKKTYDVDTYGASTASMGGVYVANNKEFAALIADEAVGTHGGEKALVTLQYVKGSADLDEDDIVGAISDGAKRVMVNISNKAPNSRASWLPKDFGTDQEKADDPYSGLSYPAQGWAVDQMIKNIDKASTLIAKETVKILSKKAQPRKTAAVLIKQMAVKLLQGASKHEDARDRWNAVGFNAFDTFRETMEDLLGKLMRQLSPDIADPRAESGSGARRIDRDVKFKGKTRILQIESPIGNIVYPANKPTTTTEFNESDVPLGKYLFHVTYASGLTGMLRDGHLGEPDEYFSMTADQKYIVSANPEVQIVIDTARVSKMETFEKYVDDWEWGAAGSGDWAKGDGGDFESEYRVEETIPWNYVVAVKILKSKATPEIIELAKKRGVKLVGKENNVLENFADGKKKGKSRPGRVKKSGASCSGSVTSLRKKAKAGGEKGRMYHWCANMKSGRKKK